MKRAGGVAARVWLLGAVAPVVLALALLAGCGSQQGGSPVAESTASPATSTASSATPASSTTSATSAPSTAPPSSAPSSPSSTLVEGPYRATTVVQGLRVPWEMRFMPDGRLLVTEREGRVVIADAGTGAVTEVGRIDVAASGESGLLGLALDPGFAETPAIYVTYTHSTQDGDQNRVSRFELTGLDSGAPRLGEETVLVDGISAASIHDGSRLAFGPDGYLWVTMGDASSGDRAQRKDSLNGKVLRMTRDGQPAPDNPFRDLAYPFSLIFTLGHRNPQGIAFHPQSGVASITEHGPSENDEVNRLQAGGNYGWPDLGGVVGRAGFIDPIATWSPTIAPAGCLFYTGSLLTDLQGDFLFVTLKGSDLRVLTPAQADDFTSVAEEATLFDERFGRLRAIAQGPDGALYIATSNRDGRGDPGPLDDRIIRIDPAD